MPEQYCRYVVISVPEGCTIVSPGDVFYEPAQQGQCPPMTLTDPGCEGTYIEVSGPYSH